MKNKLDAGDEIIIKTLRGKEYKSEIVNLKDNFMIVNLKDDLPESKFIVLFEESFMAFCNSKKDLDNGNYKNGKNIKDIKI